MRICLPNLAPAAAILAGLGRLTNTVERLEADLAAIGRVARRTRPWQPPSGHALQERRARANKRMRKRARRARQERKHVRRRR